MALLSEVQDERMGLYADFIDKYMHYDGQKASEEEQKQWHADLIDLMVACVKRIKLYSMTLSASRSVSTAVPHGEIPLRPPMRRWIMG